MGDILSFQDRRRATAIPENRPAIAVSLPDGGIRMKPGAELADLLATWTTIKRDVDAYRADLRAKGGTPFSDL